MIRLARNPEETRRRRQFIPVRAGQPPRAEPRCRQGRSQARLIVHDFAPCRLRDLVLVEWPRHLPNGAEAFRTGVERRSVRSDRRDHPCRVSVTRDCIIFRITADDIQFRTELGRRALIAARGQANFSHLAPVVRTSPARPERASDGGAGRAMIAPMTTSDGPSGADLTPAEREYIRRELDQFFSTLPSVAEGFQLRTWRGGPQKGQPKLPPPARTLVDRA